MRGASSVRRSTSSVHSARTSSRPVLLAWFAIGPLNSANVLPRSRPDFTFVMSGSASGRCTAWVSVSQRNGVSIQCRPSSAAFFSAALGAGIHCQIPKSSSRLSGKTDESRARTTSDCGKRTSSTPLTNAMPKAPSESRRRNGCSAGHAPANGATWWKSITPARS